MSVALCFWILMLFWLVFIGWTGWPTGFKSSGGNLIPFILIALLGWKVFGPGLHE